MTQLKLVWSCKSSKIASLVTKKKPAKCERCSTASGVSRSLSRKFAKLQKERPIAAALIERLVDDALADARVVSGVVLE
jgi:hypothetical protein